MAAAPRKPFVAALALITWAGTRYFAVQILGRTKKRVRVALNHALSPERVKLPSGREHLREGNAFLVPPPAIRYVATEKLEREGYEGAVYGYGGNVDARRCG